jgi:hypothetical protein
VESLTVAARLIDECTSAASTARMLAQLGFGQLVPIGVTHAGNLGLRDSVHMPHIACGHDGLRALAFEVAGELRPELERVAKSVAASAGSFQWLIVGVDRRGTEVCVAAFQFAIARPRIALLMTHRGSVVASDAETLCAMAAACSTSGLLTHVRWLEILGRESVSRKFFRALERSIGRLASAIVPPGRPDSSFDLALLYVSRLLFLSFLETKGWLDGDKQFLVNRFADCMAAGGRYHERVLAPLFFGTLNTRPNKRSERARAFGRIPFLNGGLFAKSAPERAAGLCRFSDESLGDLFGDVLSRYRFTAREDSASWSEAAIDPEMLGKAFETLMSAVARKRTGAYYTPQSLVVEITQSAIGRSTLANSLESVSGLKVLDPACGSGAFLVRALEMLAARRAELGDERPLHQIRRDVLSSSIFGVDINPTAVWLCELRLWLSMAIEDPETDPLRVCALPNLDRNIRIGDSLAGEDFSRLSLTPRGTRLRKLRMRYVRAVGRRKRSLARALDAAERGMAVATLEFRATALRAERIDLLSAARSRDLFGGRSHHGANVTQAIEQVRIESRHVKRELARLRSGGAMPFSFISGFGDVAAAGGFDIVLGNPPWVRLHNIDANSRVSLRGRFEVFRNAAWLSGSELGGTSRGFASQADTAALFVERSIRLLKRGGVMALIVPAKLSRSLAGGGVRHFLESNAELLELHDFGSADRSFDAAVYPFVVLAKASPRVAEAAPGAPIHVVAHRGGQPEHWRVERTQLGFDSSAGSPWLLVPQDVRRSFDALSRNGTPLAASIFGRPLLGVKTGCNHAFLVERAGTSQGDLARVSGNGVNAEVESCMLRPVVRGENIAPWRTTAGNTRILWTHGTDMSVLRRIPPLSQKWLRQHRHELERRSDLRSRAVWWELFRVESSDSATPRVVWADIGKRPTAAVVPAGDDLVALNTCYLVRCPTDADAFALAAILNSDVAAAWLSVLAEPARGGYRRYLGWTMSLLPLPLEWISARAHLAPIGEAAFKGSPSPAHVLVREVLAAYGISQRSMLPLLEWNR